MQRKFPLVVLLITCLLLPAGCVSKPVPQKPIRIAINVWSGYAVAYLAQEKGFFKKNNVDVELVLRESTPESLALFTDGETDGCFDVFSDIIMLNARGISAQVVYIVDYSNEGDVIIGRPEIKALSELRGKTVGFEGIDTFSRIFVLNALEKARVEESDLRFSNVKAHDVLKALDAGDIDAGHTWEPTKSEALKKGYKILAKAGDYPGMITDVLVFNATVLKERPEDVFAIVRSLAEALEYQREHLEEAVTIMAEKMGMSEQEMASGLAGIYQPGLKEGLALLTGEDPLFKDTGKKIFDFSIKRGQVSRFVEIDDMIDPKFVTELVP